MKVKDGKKKFIRALMCLVFVLLLSGCDDTTEYNLDNTLEYESMELQQDEEIFSVEEIESFVFETVEEMSIVEEVSTIEETSSVEVEQAPESVLIESTVAEQIIEESIENPVVEEPVIVEPPVEEPVIVEPPVEEQVVVTPPVADTMVWQSATGSKYHSINNCGRMNPNKATQITKSQAESMGLGACSKCW